MTKEEVAEAVRAWCRAFHTQDIETILAMEGRSVGFGFRPWAWRDHVAHDHRQAIERFFARKVSYRVELEDLQTSVEGELGLAWGVFLEAWQDHGQPPEQARVRFSKVLTKDERGWHVALYHRDIQPFTAEGWYPRELTVVAPDH